MEDINIQPTRGTIEGSSTPHQAGTAVLWETLHCSATFMRIAAEHPLWHHPFVERCRTGRLTLPEVRTLGTQMYKFCREFSRFLAKALAACPHQDARVVIAENLWEELGEGQPARAHPALFRRFTRALGINDANLECIPAEPETGELIETYLGLADRYGVLGALGALCYASEGIVAALYSNIEKGILRTIPFEKDELIFFDLHIHIDDGHAAKLEAVLASLLQTPEDFRQVEMAIQAALNARCRFFDGVLRSGTARACERRNGTGLLELKPCGIAI